jgi:dipeptidyl aminopeptidase/acylaminoacyl peptidase
VIKSLAARADLRETRLYQEVQTFYTSTLRPGSAQIVDGADLHGASSGKEAVFSGVFLDSLDSKPASRICRVDLASRKIQVLTFGPHNDFSPKYSCDERQIAFISERGRLGARLCVMDSDTGAVRCAPETEGWLEYFHWSPDDKRILLGVAGHGADVAGAHGGVATQRTDAERSPPWTPKIDIGTEPCHWRRLWIYELDEERIRPVGPRNLNFWEAVWCGNEAIAAIASEAPGESSWYRSTVLVFGLSEESPRATYRSPYQVGVLVGSPSGRRVAFVEAICSDRGMVAGELCLLDGVLGTIERIDTRGVDITCLDWRYEERLLACGHRGLETVIGYWDVSGGFTESWVSAQLTTPGICATASAGDRDSYWLIAEGFFRSPEIARVQGGKYEPVCRLGTEPSQRNEPPGNFEPVLWRAPDDLEIQGWLLRPRAAAPHALIVWVHGGPVWQWRPMWLGRRWAWVQLLLERGYAIFLPNPRGSSGRGQAFTRAVLGDMGGADTADLITGIDHLIRLGDADPKRLGIIGASYGGFMSSWLIAHDVRFRAAIPIAPVTNYVTEHLTSNIADWVRRFLADTYTNLSGRYYSRSPITYVDRVITPTLSICGALDRSAPPDQAVQFHNALLENGVKSVMVTYPQEGHGIRQFPALIDFSCRVIAWFEEHV